MQGGHVDSYTDPESGRTYEYGVQNFVDLGNATGFFDRMGVPYGPPGPRVPLMTRYVDFTTAEAVSFRAPASDAQTAALRRFLAIVEQYEHLFATGYWEWPAGKHVPDDLAMPFGEFAQKYNFEDALYLIYRITGYGIGNMSQAVTLYVLQAYGAFMARNFLGQVGALVAASGRNQDLYDAVGKHLGRDVLYSSTVISSKRTSRGVTLAVRNHENGDRTVIRAKKLLLAIEPHTRNLVPFNPTKAETAVFSKFKWTRLVTGIVHNAALPINQSLFNIPEAAEPSNYFAYQDLPYQARFDYMGEDHFRALMIGDETTNASDAKKIVQANVERLIEAGILQSPAEEEGGDGSSSSSSNTLKWIVLADHGHMHARVSGEELRKGFITNQYALQGQQSTWYTGAAFSAQFQTSLWQYNDILLPRLVESS